MLQFLVSGLGTTLIYFLPLLLLPAISMPLYRLRTSGRQQHLPPADYEWIHLNFQITRYLVYLLAIPSIMLLTSVFIGFNGGVPAILDSMIWLIVAITIAFSWCIYRLVGFVSARTRLETERHAGTAGEA